MISVGFVYILAGLLFAAVAIANFRDRSNPKRLKSTLFWGVYAITFLAGSYLPPFVNGCLVLIMVVTAGIGGLGIGKAPTTSVAEREASAKRWGNRLFIPALTFPIITVLGVLFLKYIVIDGTPLIDPKQLTLISLGIAVIVALIVACAMLRPPAMAPVTEGRRLMDSIGWAAALPQMLAALGALFATAGVGKVVAGLVTDVIPPDNAFAIVAAFAVGMALFTMIMGNGFAAFPVMTVGIGLPLIVTQMHGNAAIMGAVGMLSGFCGTLMTPMAANFNIVPAALLELPDRNGVIKAQVLTGVLLLIANIFLMYFTVFRY
ncbi:MAG TPA: DUF979 domain-containing protein [Magnetospirillaceae bacterium]|jgi:uncharacterized membrane protein